MARWITIQHNWLMKAQGQFSLKHVNSPYGKHYQLLITHTKDKTDGNPPLDMQL